VVSEGNPHAGSGPQHGQQDPERPERPVDPLPPNKQPTPSGPERPADLSSSSQDESEDSDDIMICTMMMLQCPDGTYATQNSRCEYICGAAPVGRLSWTAVEKIRQSFVSAYGSSKFSLTDVGTLANKDIVLSANETFGDYCIEVVLVDQTQASMMPAVYNGVRVFYVISTCSPILCEDGTLVSCYDVCPDEDNVEQAIALWPITIAVSVFALAACCCCMRRRRNRKCKRNTEAYPAQQYELVKQQEQTPTEEVVVAVPPHMMAPMMYPHPHQMMMPPMPPVPPHMMMNGAYPIMVQGPNGMWFPVVPQVPTEDHQA